MFWRSWNVRYISNLQEIYQVFQKEVFLLDINLEKVKVIYIKLFSFDRGRSNKIFWCIISYLEIRLKDFDDEMRRKFGKSEKEINHFCFNWQYVKCALFTYLKDLFSSACEYLFLLRHVVKNKIQRNNLTFLQKIPATIFSNHIVACSLLDLYIKRKKLIKKSYNQPNLLNSFSIIPK